MFLDFEELTLKVSEQKIFVRHGGDPGNPGLLLLHGYPQTSAMWHAVAPQLTDQFHVICPDLRGYGRSSKPASDDRHMPYSKREMAKDMVSVMSQMGHESFLVGAHDRGARVTHRMALDHPQNVQAMVLLDIAPTREMYRDTSKEFATAYWHWFFLIQKHPIPEQIIGNDPAQFWKLKCFNQAKGENPFIASALDEYIAAFSTPEGVHASCEDYRAAATIDIEHDDQDDGRKVEQPLMVLWAKRGVIETCFDAKALWQERALRVEGEALDATHYMAEEIPDEIASRMRAFFLRQIEQKDAAE